jgi:DNA-directed RNA polymerase I subunit RPA1
MLGNEVISSEVTEIRFGLYSDQEIRDLSVCKIESPTTFDTLGNPLAGGLYDDLMGPQYQYSPNCVTCGELYMHCPGHPGRIELCVPVYHPLLFKSLVMLLRAKCSNCNKLRMSEFRTRVYLVKMKLAEMGRADAIERLDALLVPSAIFQQSDADIERELCTYEAQYDVFLASNPDRSIDMHCTTKLNEIVEVFKKATTATKRCENCKAYSPSLRKDGFTKIFEKPLSRKLVRAMESTGRGKSALSLMPARTSTSAYKERQAALEKESGESDNNGDNDNSETNAGEGGDDSDSDSDDDSAAPREKKAAEGLGLGEAVVVDKYLTPLEVEARIKLLWASQGEVLDFIFLRALLRRKQLHTDDFPSSAGAGADASSKKEERRRRRQALSSGNNGEGWKLFFMTVLLVPPNRFRPPADMGDMKVEHPQNISLNKVLVSNERIQTLKKVAPTEAGAGAGSSLAVTAAGSASSINLSKIVSTWIDLQNGVNCYIDSAKDPNPLGSSSAPPGIRQLMERKEGLFRKNMMGKRVNFCCRSVLSPDPFIGSNEIGIPVMFAKELHYPTPVTSYNVKLMRQLVENGPHNYPGRESALARLG